MYKKDKVRCVCIFIIGFLINYIFNLKSISLVNEILTVISILLGFYITAVSTLFGSNIIKEYANIKDEKALSQTMLGTLIKYLKNSVLFAFFTIFVALICALFKDKNYLDKFYLKQIISSILTASTFLSLFLFLLLMKIFFALFYNEGSKRK